MKSKKLIENIVPKALFLIAVVAIWQYIYSKGIYGEKIFPSIPQIGKALVNGFTDGEMLSVVKNSMLSIFQGLFFGVIMAFLLSGLAIVSKAF